MSERKQGLRIWIAAKFLRPYDLQVKSYLP